MRRLVLTGILIATTLQAAPAQKPKQTTKQTAKQTAKPKIRGIAVAYYDEGRLRGPDGKSTLENFLFFLKHIQEVAKEDFPDVEFRVLRRGELLRLPDGTALNVQTLEPETGYVLSMSGRKRKMLEGLQTDADFACAAAAFFRRPSKACPKK